MTEQQHCPGFESNKSITEITLKCPECGKDTAIFSDELDKKAKCSGCDILLDPQTCRND